MILTTKARYAVMAVIEIANNKEQGPLPLTEIAKRQEISLSYLERIFSILKDANIVAATKGPGGGYSLARPRKEITVSQIVKAIGEPIKMTRCNEGQRSCLKGSSRCKAHHIWSGLEKKIYSYLDSLVLSDL